MNPSYYNPSYQPKGRIDLPVYHPATLFPGDTPFKAEATEGNFSADGICHVSKVVHTFSSHAGTHADQPRHVCDGGEPFGESVYSGPAYVLDVSSRLQKATTVTRAMIEDELGFQIQKRKRDGREGIPLHHLERLLICTGNDPNPNLEYAKPRFTSLSIDAAQFLADKRNKREPQSFDNMHPVDLYCMLGIDSPSVDKPDEKNLAKNVHGILFDARIAIVENLYLLGVSDAGQVSTEFDPLRDFPDAKGIARMNFVPGDIPYQRTMFTCG